MNIDIVERFKEFLKDKDISPSELADKIGVQRSSISHILSGRNKPSLDFIVKLLEQFPNLNIYWLLNNKGEKYKIESNSPSPSLLGSNKAEEISSNQKEKLNLNTGSSKKIKHITIFYDDNTFEHYTPN